MNSSMRQVPLIYLFYTLNNNNWGLERLNNLPKVTKPYKKVSGIKPKSVDSRPPPPTHALFNSFFPPGLNHSIQTTFYMTPKTDSISSLISKQQCCLLTFLYGSTSEKKNGEQGSSCTVCLSTTWIFLHLFHSWWKFCLIHFILQIIQISKVPRPIQLAYKQ